MGKLDLMGGVGKKQHAPVYLIPVANYTAAITDMVLTRKTNSLRPRAPPASKNALAKASAGSAKAEKPKPARKEKPKKVGDYTTFRLPNKKVAIGEIVAVEKNGAYVVEMLTEERIMGKGKGKGKGKGGAGKMVGDYTLMDVGNGEKAIGEIVGVKNDGGFVVEMITAESLSPKKKAQKKK